MANETTVSTAAADLAELIADVAEVTSVQARVLRGLTKEVDFTGKGNTIDLITFDDIDATSYTEGNSRTFVSGDPTKNTGTPAEIDASMAFSDKVMKRSHHNLPASYGPILGRSIAVQVDQDGITAAGSFSGTDVSEGDAVASMAGLIASIGGVRTAMKDYNGSIGAVLHTSAWQALVSDATVVAASIRGPQGQGLFSGEFTLLGGSTIRFTTGIGLAGSTALIAYQNLVFTNRALALVWKQGLNVEAWRDANTKTQRISAGADYSWVLDFAAEGLNYLVLD